MEEEKNFEQKPAPATHQETTVETAERMIAEGKEEMADLLGKIETAYQERMKKLRSCRARKKECLF